MSGYTQLTQEERYQIHILKRAGHTQSEMAEMLGRHKATISKASVSAMSGFTSFSTLISVTGVTYTAICAVVRSGASLAGITLRWMWRNCWDSSKSLAFRQIFRG